MIPILRVRDEDGNVVDIPAIRGEAGASIVSIVRTSGAGKAGTTDTYTITLSDGRKFEFQVYNGADGTMTFDDLTEEQKESLRGADGKDGVDGYTPQKGIDYFDGKDGEDGYTPVKGVDYFDGKDGYTPVKGVDYFDGANGQDGKTPVKGTDYWTAEDKAEMVADVLAALPAAEGGSY